MRCWRGEGCWLRRECREVGGRAAELRQTAVCLTTSFICDPPAREPSVHLLWCVAAEPTARAAPRRRCDRTPSQVQAGRDAPLAVDVWIKNTSCRLSSIREKTGTRLFSSLSLFFSHRHYHPHGSQNGNGADPIFVSAPIGYFLSVFCIPESHILLTRCSDAQIEWCIVLPCRVASRRELRRVPARCLSCSQFITELCE